MPLRAETIRASARQDGISRSGQPARASRTQRAASVRSPSRSAAVPSTILIRPDSDEPSGTWARSSSSAALTGAESPIRVRTSNPISSSLDQQIPALDCAGGLGQLLGVLDQPVQTEVQPSLQAAQVIEDRALTGVGREVVARYPGRLGDPGPGA